MSRAFNLLFAICTFMAFGLARADVQITEVMADPSGSEFRNEYIELTNLGNSPVNLDRWSISDEVTTDLLVFASKSVLAPGQRCLILDPDYEAGDQPYGAFPVETLIARVGDHTIGSAGLDNRFPERITLRDSEGEEKDTIVYDVGRAGHSFEARVLLDGEIAGWDFSRMIGGSPGRVNSVAEGRSDVSLDFIEQPDTLLAAEIPARVRLVVANEGGTHAASVAVRLVWGEHDSLISVGDLEPGETVDLSLGLPLLYGSRVGFEAHVVLSGDQDPTNDTLTWTAQFGVRVGSVVINELMPVPLDGNEWIEIRSLLGHAVSLSGWTLVDEAERMGKLPPVTLQPDEFAVLHRETAKDGWLAVSDWPSLNNSGDRLRLIDASGSVIDEVVYADAEPGRSLERIDPQSAGVGANWISNALDPGGTPGRSNRAGPVASSLDLKASPEVFDDLTTISANLPHPRATVTLYVYDRRGRLHRRLLDGVEVGASIAVSWDGRDEGHRVVRPGIYTLFMEIVGQNGGVEHARSQVVYAKGLKKKKMG
jgi:hypothetical protein